MSNPSEPTGPQGRYRFRRGRSLDPQEELHPEMSATDLDVQATTPDSPEALMALQQPGQERPDKPEQRTPAKVREALQWLDGLDTSPLEDQLIALSLLRRLETYHERIVAAMEDDDTARHSQIVLWAVDADRLLQARQLLESVDLE